MGWRRIVAQHPEASAALGLAALALVTFLPLVFGRVLFERDIQTYWVSQVEAFVRTVAAGSWPVWDPWVAFGQPMLAKPDTQVLYPFTWLNLILPLGPAYTLFVLAHLALSGVGLVRLARCLGSGPSGAFVAAAVWMLSGPLVSMANLWHHFAGVAWMPWVAEAAERAARSPDEPRHVVRWGLLAGLQLLAGSADAAAMTAFVCAGLVARHLLSSGGGLRPRLRIAGGAIGAAALALASSAALWIPTLEVARNSIRWSLPASIQHYWSVHPLSLLQLGLPLFVVDLPLQGQWRQALFEGREPFLESMYFGLPALCLAAAALVSRARHAGFLAGIALVAGLVALGRHSLFHAAALGIFPPLGILRFPQKAMILVALPLALLAGLGFDAWRRPDFWKSRRLFLAGLVLVTAVAVLAATLVIFGAEPLGRAALLPEPDAGAPYRSIWAPVAAQLLLAAVCAAFVLVAGALAASGGVSASRSAAAVGALAVISLVAAHRTLHPTAPAALFAAQSALLEVLKPTPAVRILTYDYFTVLGSSERYLGRRLSQLVDTLPPGWSYREGVALGLQQYLVAPMPTRYGIFGSFDVDQRGLYSRELDELTRLPWALDRVPAARNRLLQQGGVTHVVALHAEGFEALTEVGRFPSVYPEPIRVFAVPDPLPRSYVAEGIRILKAADALRTLGDPDFDFRREVLLADGPSPRRAEPDAAGESRIVSYLPDRVELHVTARRPALVVLLDSFDPGWRAWVDGQPARVLRANLAFRAVELPAGEHRVVMLYRPRALFFGIVVSAVTAVLTLGALAWFWTRRRMPDAAGLDGTSS